MPRIAHVISTREGSGGAEQILAALVRGGQERGWEQLVLNPLATKASRGDVRTLCAGAGYEAFDQSGVRGAIAVRRWLAARLDDFAPDIVQAHLAHALVLVATLPRRGGRALVLTHHHGDHFQTTGARGKLLVDRIAGRRFDRVVAISGFVADHLLNGYGYPADKVVCIPNGWAGEPIARRRTSVPTVVCVANFRPQKDHASLLRAFKRVLDEEGPPVRLKLVGDGELRPALEKQSADLGIQKAVEFIGPVQDVWPILANADVFVLPSLYEPFGLVVLEAMAAGVPVIATAVGAMPELVDAGRNGVLVDPGNDTQMAHEIRRLLSEPSLVSRLTAAARRTAEEYRIDRMLNSYFRLYEELLAS